MYLPQKVPKFIRDRSSLSVRQIQHALSSGRVTLIESGHEVRHQLEDRYVLEEDVVLLDGERVSERRPTATFILNKPRSVTVTKRDPGGKQDLSRWLRGLPEGTVPIGRLDRDTTGALLLSTDGDLATVVSRPEHQIAKTYWLWLNEALNADDPRLAEWTRGLVLRGRQVRAQSVRILHSTEDMTELLMVLGQGMNRQIRRMCRAADLRLLHLHRRAVGSVTVDELPIGELRELTPEEVNSLWDAAGGRQGLLRLKRRALLDQIDRARQSGRPLSRLENWASSTEHPP